MTHRASEAALDRIDHLAVSVRDVAEAVAWYTANFRCSVAYQDSTWALLDFENTRLALVIPDQHPAHLALSSPEAARFGALVTRRDGTRSTYVADPSGNSVEIMAAD